MLKGFTNIYLKNLFLRITQFTRILRILLKIFHLVLMRWIEVKLKKVYVYKRCTVLLYSLSKSIFHSQCEWEEEWEDSWIFIWTNKQGGVSILQNIDSWACDASLFFIFNIQHCSMLSMNCTANDLNSVSNWVSNCSGHLPTIHIIIGNL